MDCKSQFYNVCVDLNAVIIKLGLPYDVYLRLDKWLEILFIISMVEIATEPLERQIKRYVGIS